MKINQINKLGQRVRRTLRSGNLITLTDKILLQELRVSFKSDIKSVFNFLITDVDNNEHHVIYTYRIKRIDSIISKIRREPTMSLSKMGDIAGCRIITENENEIIKYKELIEKKFEVLKVNNYYKNQKQDGYRALHYYIKSPINPSKSIEIQIRDSTSHDWASFVEILDNLYSLKMKEGEEQSDLNRLLKLLSISQNKLTENEIKEILDIDYKYQILLRLNKVFHKNSFQVRKQWLDINMNNNLFILKLNKTGDSTIKDFKYFEKAEVSYFEEYSKDQFINVVLIYLYNNTFKHIEIAYSSYILTNHSYFQKYIDYLNKVFYTDSYKTTDLDLLKYIVTVFTDKQNNFGEEIKFIENVQDLLLNKIDIKNAVNEWKVNEIKKWVIEMQNDFKISQKNFKKILDIVNKSKGN